MTPKQRKSIPREAWAMLADERARSARELLWLVSRSLEVVAAGYEGRDGLQTDPEGLDGDDLFHVAGARGIAEGRILEEADGPDRSHPEGFLEAELRCLLGTLQGMAVSLTNRAETCFRLAQSSRRGRPPKRDLNALVKLEGFKWGLPKLGARKPGRPRVAPISDEDLLRELSEAKKAGGKRSERAILEGIARRLLIAQGRHTAGDRLRQLTANLQKRVAASRAGGVPKLAREMAVIRQDESE